MFRRLSQRQPLSGLALIIYDQHGPNPKSTGAWGSQTQAAATPEALVQLVGLQPPRELIPFREALAVDGEPHLLSRTRAADSAERVMLVVRGKTGKKNPRKMRYRSYWRAPKM